jgi:peptidoglycan/LPS O-acetylase OafA/YrhL
VNWRLADRSVDYLAAVTAASPLQHFWSLAVEEQFYLAWPWLVVWAPARWLGPLVLATIAAGPLSHLAAASRGLGEPFWALVPLGSADSLGVGAWIAWRVWAAGPDAVSRPLPRAGALGLAAWLALSVSETLSGPVPPAIAAWRQALQALVFGAVVWTATLGFTGRAGRVLGHPAVVWVGRVSYGVYLVHAFAPIVVDRVVARVAPGAGLSIGLRAAAAWSVSLGLAAVLWYVVEAPARRLKARF